MQVYRGGGPNLRTYLKDITLGNLNYVYENEKHFVTRPKVTGCMPCFHIYGDRSDLMPER